MDYKLVNKLEQVKGGKPRRLEVQRHPSRRPVLQGRFKMVKVGQTYVGAKNSHFEPFSVSGSQAQQPNRCGCRLKDFLCLELQAGGLQKKYETPNWILQGHFSQFGLTSHKGSYSGKAACTDGGGEVRDSGCCGSIGRSLKRPWLVPGAKGRRVRTQCAQELRSSGTVAVF